MADFVSDSEAWKRLESHAEEIRSLHLRELMLDETRCAGLVAEKGDIVLDYSRERVLPQTMVSFD